jgi:plastocyanin
MLSGSCALTPVPREVLLVARGMTFILADQPEVPNPVIPMHAGERVRLVLKNEAPGLLHDVAIPAWKIETSQIRAGETTEVTFTVPNQPGRHGYRCRPHSEMMSGFVEVMP